MRDKLMPGLGACAVLAAIVVPVLAQDTGKTDATPPPVTSGTNPPADTQAPGKTATDAVTNPSQVPPSDGQFGTGTPPTTEGSAGGPAAR